MFFTMVSIVYLHRIWHDGYIYVPTWGIVFTQIGFIAIVINLYFSLINSYLCNFIYL